MRDTHLFLLLFSTCSFHTQHLLNCWRLGLAWNNRTVAAGGLASSWALARTHAQCAVVFSAVRMRSLGATVHRAVGASHLAKLRLVIFSKNLEFTTVFFRYQWSGTAHWKSGGTARRCACVRGEPARVCARGGDSKPGLGLRAANYYPAA